MAKYKLKDSLEIKPFKYSQIRKELKNDTQNFTLKSGEFIYGFEEEAINSASILSKYYNDVDYYLTDDTWNREPNYVVKFKGLKKIIELLKKILVV